MVTWSFINLNPSSLRSDVHKSCPKCHCPPLFLNHFLIPIFLLTIPRIQIFHQSFLNFSLITTWSSLESESSPDRHAIVLVVCWCYVVTCSSGPSFEHALIPSVTPPAPRRPVQPKPNRSEPNRVPIGVTLRNNSGNNTYTHQINSFIYGSVWYILLITHLTHTT